MLRPGFRAVLVSIPALAAACAGEPAPAPAASAALPALSIEREAVPGGTRLLLITRPGTRINAATRPALHLADGAVIHFDTSAVTGASLY